MFHGTTVQATISRVVDFLYKDNFDFQETIIRERFSLYFIKYSNATFSENASALPDSMTHRTATKYRYLELAKIFSTPERKFIETYFSSLILE